MSCIVLTHLGKSTPPYLEDCCHQIRLWNPTDFRILLLLEGVHHRENPFFLRLQDTYDVSLIFTESLKPTPHHRAFLDFFANPNQAELLAFRNGYWKFVKERFFFLEEVMLAKELTHVISMEYDILVYANIKATLLHKFQTSHPTLRVVKDNETRGHPGFMYIPSAAAMQHFNEFVVSTLDKEIEDMQTLCLYGETHPTRLNYLPCISDKTNQLKPVRESLDKEHTVTNPWFLSQDSEHFGVLFDSLVIGQALGGIDPRNNDGKKFSPYWNEGALYNIKEILRGGWAKDAQNRWVPIFDGRCVVTIHVHCKALSSYLSSRIDMPKDDYVVGTVLQTLEKN